MRCVTACLLEPLGDVAHFIVRRELAYIFDYRQKAVAEILGHVKAAATNEIN